MDQFTVLLSRKFKEAHDAFRGKRKMDQRTEEWLESMKRINVPRFPMNVAKYLQGFFSFYILCIEEHITIQTTVNSFPLIR